jgi:superfamily I DNA and/or RNA helicase
MHPLISMWPNSQFYNGQLRDGVSADCRIPPSCIPWPKKGPYLFVPITDGREETRKPGKSKLNRIEALKVLNFVTVLLQGISFCQKKVAVFIQ